jgi:hypothetical protein
MHHIRNLAAKWLQLSKEEGGTREMAIEGLRRQRMNAEAMKDRRKQQSTKPTTHDTLSQTLSQYRAKCNSARPRVSDGSQSQVEVPVSSSQKLQTDNSHTTIDTLTQAFTQSTSRGQRRAISSQKWILSSFIMRSSIIDLFYFVVHVWNILYCWISLISFTDIFSVRFSPSNEFFSL